MVSHNKEGLKKIDAPCESKTLTKAFATKFCRKAMNAPRKIDSGCIRSCFLASATLTTRLATKWCRRAGKASKKSIPPVNQKLSRKLLRLNGVARQRTHREKSSLDASARVFSHQQPYKPRPQNIPWEKRSNYDSEIATLKNKLVSK